jgi:hypothetical protein
VAEVLDVRGRVEAEQVEVQHRVEELLGPRQ